MLTLCENSLKYCRLILVIALFFSAVSVTSQQKIPGKHSVIMMNFKLPQILGNKSFKGVMSGLANVDFTYQYNLNNDFGIGAGFKYAYFELVGTAFVGGVDGDMEGYNPFIKISKRKIVSEILFLEASLSCGYNLLYTYSNQCDDLYKQEGVNVMPQIGLYMESSDFLSFGLIVSYNYIGSEFTPDNICMKSFPGFNPSSSIGNTHVFAVGFGFSVFLPEKK